MTFSGPKDCRGSMNEARILPHFLHSARRCVLFRQSVSFSTAAAPTKQRLAWLARGGRGSYTTATTGEGY